MEGSAKSYKQAKQLAKKLVDAPWKKKNPKGKSTPLSPAQKTSAKASARRAGRPYPNLVDNMNAARKGKKR